ncbi:MAG TPA: cyclase family protein [Cyclobacteriaceae bacterium]|nr:cyclase family protein [Cyclobacteriaceae bacterium]
MIIHLTYNNKKYNANLSAPLDISLPLNEGNNNPNCYWAEPVKFETISAGNFIGSVKAGGNVNYQKLTFAPHGNGTHTECFGHLSADEAATINKSLTNFHFIAEVISVTPEKSSNGDLVITLDQVKGKIKHPQAQALVIRTLPNTDSKKTQQYSGTNPPYLEAAVNEYLAKNGVLHLLVDLPSLDREVDGGKLLAHKSFWNFDQNVRKGATITELIFVENSIPDDLFLLNLQITSLEMDASPSKPVLYKLAEVL